MYVDKDENDNGLYEVSIAIELFIWKKDNLRRCLYFFQRCRLVFRVIKKVEESKNAVGASDQSIAEDSETDQNNE